MMSPRWSRAAIVAALVSALPAIADEEPWVAPDEDRDRPNPVPRASGAAKAPQLFTTNCVPCHGPQGMGDGPSAATLNPRPKNLTSREVQAETDGALFWKMTTGRNAMPAWLPLAEKQRWILVNYIRKLGARYGDGGAAAK